ncbi:MAG: XRE family transcriptional regulator [Caulobacteraceae bacterium]|nr:XRE family transcriptional regulator [Caulobacteraceae bacterium]
MKLERYIEQSGLTQAEFAKMAGISQPTISRLLHGALPSLKTMRALYRVTSGKVAANDFYKLAVEQHQPAE